jgi:hypothetical protein
MKHLKQSLIDRAKHVKELENIRVDSECDAYIRGDADASFGCGLNGGQYKNDMAQWINYVIGYDDAMTRVAAG